MEAPAATLQGQELTAGEGAGGGPLTTETTLTRATQGPLALLYPVEAAGASAVGQQGVPFEPPSEWATLEDRQQRYLLGLVLVGTQTAGEQAARVARQTVHAWRTDPHFLGIENAAKERAADMLVAEAVRRATRGTMRVKPHVMRDRTEYEVIVEYSDALLIKLLEARVEGFRPKVDVTHVGGTDAAALVAELPPDRKRALLMAIRGLTPEEYERQRASVTEVLGTVMREAGEREAVVLARRAEEEGLEPTPSPAEGEQGAEVPQRGVSGGEDDAIDAEFAPILPDSV